MTSHTERRANPTLLGGQRRQTRDTRLDSGHPPTLVDLMHEGFYALFLVLNGATALSDSEGDGDGEAEADAAPSSKVLAADGAASVAERAAKRASAIRVGARKSRKRSPFVHNIVSFLADFDREARKLQIPGEDIDAAKFAFCATFDEFMLNSSVSLREACESQPLQLKVFRDQHAGEYFFEQLETLRSKGGMRLQALEVFHMCLLLGFHGRFTEDTIDKLAYITARVGDEIVHIKGKSRGFAPQAERPDQIVNKLRSDLPLWALSAVFALIGLGAYAGLESSLRHSTQDSLAGYTDLVKLAPPPANVTITLP